MALSLLKKEINEVLFKSSPKCIDKLLDLIILHNGIIFGSVSNNVMSNLCGVNTAKRSNDVDIIFISNDTQCKFISDITEAFNRINVTIDGTVTCHVTLSKKSNLYGFSELIDKEKQDQVNLTFVLQPDVITKIQLDLCCVADESMTPSNYIDFINSRVFDKKNSAYGLNHNGDILQISYSSFITHEMNQYTKPQNMSLTDEPVTHRKLLHEAKLNYQSMKLVVLPLSAKDSSGAGKAPACRDWANKTIDFDFSTFRACDNIGILCGKESGIVCIDVDMKDNGVAYFDKLMKNYGHLNCPTQVTPNGGYHYIFKYNHARMMNMKVKIKGVRINGMPVGVDFLIQNCQFVVSPSINYTNKLSYKWKTPIVSRASIPELPEWIYDLYNHTNITEDGKIITNKSIADKSTISSVTKIPQPAMNDVSNQMENMISLSDISFELDLFTILRFTLMIIGISILLVLMFAIWLMIGLIGILAPNQYRIKKMCISAISRLIATYSIE